MKEFFRKLDEDQYIIRAPMYTIEIDGHIVSVMSDQDPLVRLDIRSAIPKTCDDDSSAIEDHEPSIPVLTNVDVQTGKVIFTWENESSLWKKIYHLECTWLHYIYRIEVIGEGRVDAVKYFSGDLSALVNGSEYNFSEGFMPASNMYDLHNYAFPASRPFHGYSTEMVPPMFCYAFRTEGYAKHIGFGVVAEPGEHNFHSFDYQKTANRKHGRWTGFYLETDQAGHVTVDGQWQTPAILGLTGDDPWQILQQYCDYYFGVGYAKPYPENVQRPRFWYGPFVCGWLEQYLLKMDQGLKISLFDYSNQKVYDDMMEKVNKYGLKPTAMFIDDKWQKEYALCYVNQEKFPDFRGFIDKYHAQGIKTVLWYKLFDPEGLPEELCVTNDAGERFADISNPAYLEILDEAIYRMLSSDPGCYNADGFKIDFGFLNPIGRKVKTYSGKYGAELLYELFVHIYEKAKSIKPDVLINCSPCHPYFAHLCDQARIHDYADENRNNFEELALRAKVFQTAFPGVLIDTDNAAFNTHRDTMRWQLSQQFVGVPDLYSTVSTFNCPLDESDFLAIAQMWKLYSAKIDAKYGIK